MTVNKEIEEILNELKDVAKRNTIEVKEYGVVETISSSIAKELRLNDYSANLLLSYIEQLEKENDRLKKDYAIVINDNCDYITLEKKIEQLEKRNKEIYEGFMATQEELTDYATENEQLKHNRDKAIEYINSHFIFNDKTGECYQTYTFDKDNVKKLYDILKGDSDE